MSGELVLVVDDEASIVSLARLYLEREGFRVESVGDGRAALQAIQTLNPALVVLDLMLPEMDGFEVCKRIRMDDNRLSVLMLTARDEDIDKILGLELGADDYMTKPFNPRELVARVKAILRRSVVPTAPAVVDSQKQPPEEVISLGGLKIYPARREVWIDRSSVDLRTQEFEVMMVLVQHRGLVLSREQLLNLAWGYDFLGQTRTVDVHIAQLRRKLEGGGVRIETVTGIGYKLVV